MDPLTRVKPGSDPGVDSAVGQERCVKWGWREWGLQCAAAVCVCVLGWGWVAGSESQWKMAYVEGASFDT